MDGEYDAVMEDALPPPSSIEFTPDDVEPGIRRDYRDMEFELDATERQTPDAPRRRRDQPQPHPDRAEDLLDGGAPAERRGQMLPGILEWTDDGAWNDGFGLDVTEGF